MANNIGSKVIGMEGRVKGEYEEGYSGAVQQGGDVEQDGAGDLNRLEEYFTYMDLNWQQLFRTHPDATIPALQEIILASWKNKVNFKESNTDQSEGTQAADKNLKRVKKKDLKSKNVMSYSGDGLVNPYFQKMIDSVDPADNADGSIGNSEEPQTNGIDEDEEMDIYQDIDFNSVTRPAQRKSKMWETPYIKPPKSVHKKVNKKFPRCAELMTKCMMEKNNTVPNLQLDSEKQYSKDITAGHHDFGIETVNGAGANNTEKEEGEANTEKEEGEANTEKEECEANTEKEEDEANTEKNFDGGGNGIVMIDEVRSQTRINTVEGNVNEEKARDVNLKSKYNCKKCEKTFVQLGSLKSHKCDGDADNSSKIPCPSCSKLISRSNISHHLKVHSSGQFLKCKKCNLDFRNILEKKEHMLVHSKHICNYCGKVFKRPSILKGHVAAAHRDEHCSEQDAVDEVQSKPKEYSCYYCKSLFPSISSLKTHLNKEHSRAGKKCSECDHVFFSKRGLREHMRTHASVIEQQETLEFQRYVKESSRDNVVIQVLQQVDAETATFEEIAISEFDPNMLS